MADTFFVCMSGGTAGKDGCNLELSLSVMEHTVQGYATLKQSDDSHGTTHFTLRGMVSQIIFHSGVENILHVNGGEIYGKKIQLTVQAKIDSAYEQGMSTVIYQEEGKAPVTYNNLPLVRSKCQTA